MDKLPPEILCDIFLRNVPHKHDQDVSRDSIHDTSAIRASVLAPLYASHVCRTWRHLSLSCGELWSYLQISVDYESWKCKAKRKRILEIFDTWLSRTNGYPISYIFHCRLQDNGDIGMHRDAAYIITTLIAQQHRWKDVSFSWINVRMSSKFPGLVLTNMPMLTSLSLSSRYLGLRNSNKQLRATVSIAKSSKLKSLHLWGDYELDTGNAPIHSLTEPSSMCFQSSSRDCVRDCVRDCLRFLGVAPNLTVFRFDFPYSYQSLSWDIMVPTIVPRLRNLVASGHWSPLVIDNLILPSLETLICDRSRLRDSEIYRNFFQRSLPPLTQSEFYKKDADAFISSLSLLPTLKRLRISRSQISSLFFHELAVDVPEHDLATDVRVVYPSLVFLGVYDSRIQNLNACTNALFSMVKSRAEVLGTFKTVELYITVEKFSWKHCRTECYVRRLEDLLKCDAGWVVKFLRRGLFRG